MNWFRQLREQDRMAPKEYADEEAREMLLTALEKEREAFRREGFEQGTVEQVNALLAGNEDDA